MGQQDVSNPAGASVRMSRQPRRDTAPELALRRQLHADGYRFRVIWPVPGLPKRSIDVAFPGLRVAVFVDGCFWHGCPDRGTQPKTNSEWWAAKLTGNRMRDRGTTSHLRERGWTVVRLWEHTDPVEGARVVEQAVQRARQGRTSDART